MRLRWLRAEASPMWFHAISNFKFTIFNNIWIDSSGLIYVGETETCWSGAVRRQSQAGVSVQYDCLLAWNVHCGWRWSDCSRAMTAVLLLNTEPLTWKSERNMTEAKQRAAEGDPLTGLTYVGPPDTYYPWFKWRLNQNKWNRSQYESPEPRTMNVTCRTAVSSTCPGAVSCLILGTSLCSNVQWFHMTQVCHRSSGGAGTDTLISCPSESFSWLGSGCRPVVCDWSQWNEM